MIRVACLDPHELMLAGMARMFEAEPDICVVALGQDLASVLAGAGDEPPDVLITEVELGNVHGIEIVSTVAEQHSSVRVLVYCSKVRERCVRAVLAAGASGVLAKSDPPAELLAAVRHVTASPQVFLSTSVRNVLNSPTESNGHPDSPLLADLTRREFQVLKLIGRGMTRKEIARVLGRSPKTVDAHRVSIQTKLGLNDRVQLARFAIREGLVDV